jgi:hypothetical protein
MMHDHARPPSAVRQMSPATYLRLRREAAGLTIVQAAARFYTDPAHRADCEANLRSFETEGVTIKDVHRFDLQRAFPFDPGIYVMLAEAPADQHPTLCGGCGWDQWSSGYDLNGDEITWAKPRLCTRCDQAAGKQGSLL